MSYRDAESAEEADSVPERWRKERTLKKAEDPADFDPQLLKRTKGGRYKIAQVPAEYEGLKSGDNIAMVLGGSGDLVAHALSKRDELIGASVYRIPSFILSDERPGEKEEDAHNLALLLDNPELFYQVEPRDRDTIYLRQAFDYRTDAMKARIACKQRLIQRARRGGLCRPRRRVPGTLARRSLCGPRGQRRDLPSAPPGGEASREGSHSCGRGNGGVATHLR